MRSIHFSKTEWALLMCAIIALCVLAGCSWGVRPPGSGAGTPGVSGGPSGALTHLAVTATWVAGIGLLGSAIIAFLLPAFANLCWRIASGCAMLIAASQVVYWIGTHLWFMVLALAGVGAAWAWAHIKIIEKWLGRDLSGDGKVG